MELNICHMYPDLLNLYGDRGNILCMLRRLQRRGIGCTVTEIPAGPSPGLGGFDLFFLGGGQDFEQRVLLEDLRGGKARGIRDAVSDGKTFLAICGGYQLLGQYYRMADGTECEYTGALDLYTTAGEKRMTGNCACDAGEAGVLVGFENHAGKTYLAPGLAPLGRVLRGCGNNGADGGEGVRCKNVFATYYHGPLLPRNPALCDLLLLTALRRKYGDAELAPLDGEPEKNARDAALKRMRIRERRRR